MHCIRAECSLSTGIIFAPLRLAAFHISFPQTMASLFAVAKSVPHSRAAIDGLSPANPVTAQITRSHSIFANSIIESIFFASFEGEISPFSRQ